MPQNDCVRRLNILHDLPPAGPSGTELETGGEGTFLFAFPTLGTI